jgi:chromosome partitioning protein
MAVTVSFINFKGGVGKTTLCVEIAASLAYKFNERVLIVDLDPQTNATLSLMSEKEWQKQAEQNGTLRDYFDSCHTGNSFDITSILVRSPVNYGERLKNLDLIPSHIELFGMDLRLATKFGHENLKAKLFLKKSLKEIESNYDYIFFDCPPNLYLATQNGLFASQHYVIVALAEYLSTLGIAHIQKSVSGLFLEAQDLLKDAGGSSASLITPSVLGIIFNRVRYVTGGTDDENGIMNQIKSRYPELTFNNNVPQSTQIASRPQSKVPIAVSGYAVDRKYEERIRAVAEEFYDRLTRPAGASK